MATTIDRMSNVLQRAQQESAKEIKDQTTLQQQMVEQLKDAYNELKSIREFFLKDREQQRKWREDDLARQEEANREKKTEVKATTSSPNNPEAKSVGLGDLMQSLLMGAVLSKLGLDEAILAFKHGLTIVKNVLLEGGKILSTIVAPFIDIFKKLKYEFDFLVLLVRENKIVDNIISGVNKFFDGLKAIGNFFFDNPITRTIGNVLKSFGDDIGKTISGILGPIKGVFGSIFKVIGSKLLFWVFGIIDFFTGFLDEYKAGGGFWSSVGAGLNEFLRGFFTRPLDLLKDGISWLMKKVGLEETSKWLDSFSFTEMFDTYLAPFIKNIFSSVGKVLTTVVGWLGTLFTDPVQAFKDVAGGTIDILSSFGSWLYEKTKLKAFVGWLSNLFPEDIIGSIKTLAGDTLTTITNFAGWAHDKTIGAFTKWLSNLFPEDIIGSIKTLAGDALSAITDFAKWSYDKTVGKFTSWVSNLFPEDIIGSLTTLATDALAMFSNFGKWVYDKTIQPVVDWMKSLFPSKEDLNKALSFAAEAFNPLKLLSDLGAMITETIKGMIRSALPDQNGFAGSILSKTGIYDAVKEAPAASSQPQVEAIVDPTIVSRSRNIDRNAIQERVQSQSPPIVVAPSTVINNSGGRDSSPSVSGNINVNTSPGKSSYEDPVTMWNAM